MYVRGLIVQPADMGMKEKTKNMRQIRQGGSVVTSSMCSIQVALGGEPGSEWPSGAVVDVEAERSRKNLALMSVRRNGSCI